LTNISATIIRNHLKKDSEVIQKLLPSFESLDNNINQLYENNHNYEDKIYELESKIEELENKIGDLDSRLDEMENPKSNYDY
jgi:archaellum component FlaC